MTVTNSKDAQLNELLHIINRFHMLPLYTDFCSFYILLRRIVRELQRVSHRSIPAAAKVIHRAPSVGGATSADFHGLSAEIYRLLQTSVDFYRLLQTSTDICAILRISTDFCRLLQTSTDFCRHPQTSAPFYGSPQTSADFCRLLRTSVDFCRLL